jgi:diaminopropionate ammonia-lyase
MSESRFRYCLNPFWKATPTSNLKAFNRTSLADVLDFHKSLPEYNPTPLVKLDKLALNLGVGSILIKDESFRLGLNSFKGLGACYAIRKLVQPEDRRPLTVSAATEGNHGLAVAWMARRSGLKSIIYAPSDTSEVRLEAIRREGGQLVTVKGSYEDIVRLMAEESAEKQYQVVSDTGYEGYTEIPLLISLGYLTLFRELEEQIEFNHLPKPDLVFLQGGVGGLASAGIGYFESCASWVQPPIIATAEPLEADCLLASANSSNGSPQRSSGRLHTKMSGLNCGFPSIVAWPIVRSGANLLMSVHDDYATEAVALLKNPDSPDPIVRSSESGAAGLAALLACCRDPDPELRDLLGLGAQTTVLLINTEGPESALLNRTIQGTP